MIFRSRCWIHYLLVTYDLNLLVRIICHFHSSFDRRWRTMASSIILCFFVVLAGVNCCSNYGFSCSYCVASGCEFLVTMTKDTLCVESSEDYDDVKAFADYNEACEFIGNLLSGKNILFSFPHTLKASFHEKSFLKRKNLFL